MEALFVLVGFIGLLVVVVAIISAFSEVSPVAQLPVTETPEYRVRYRLMNNSESSFFHLLRKELPPEFHIFPKMRIADILETIDGKGYYTRRNKILPKHIDFVVCDNNFRPRLAIEIDGSSHNRTDQRERDRLKDQVFQNAGLPLVRIIVGSSFADNIVKIKALINNEV